ncbi:MAG: ABC transporter ATP-binding protein [Candidatus Paceibacterota bacterium]
MAIKQKKKEKFTRRTFYEGLRIVGGYLAPHRTLVIFLVVLSMVQAMASAFVPLFAGKIFDQIVSLSEVHTLSLMPVLLIIAVWLILRFGGDITDWWTGLRTQWLSTFLESDYVSKGFGRLLELPISFHKDKKQGEVGNSITRAAGWLNQIVGNIAIDLLPNFLSIIVAGAIAAFINVWLALILLISILIYVAMLLSVAPRLAAIQMKIQAAYNRAYGAAYDTLGNIQEIKQAGSEKYEQDKLHRNLIGKAVPTWAESMHLYQLMHVFQRVLVTLSQLAIFIVSLFFVRNGTLTPGQLVAFNGYAAMILGPFVALGNNWRFMQNGFVEMVKVGKTLSLPPENYAPIGSYPIQKLKGDVAFSHVSFAYDGGAKETLRDVSFAVHSGQKVALVGESGVGKTTIINLLLGLYFPQKGKITVDGVPTSKLHLASYRLRVGVVPQEPTLFNDTIEDNIRYGNFKKPHKDVIRAAQLARADVFIDAFPKKYKQLVGWRGIKLSIGQKQRIAIARAFLRDPDILILDEPTSALDAASEHVIKKSFDELMENRTTFIIGHRLSTVREADMILVFEKGSVVESGTHNELMRIDGGVYRHLYELQTGVHDL